MFFVDHHKTEVGTCTELAPATLRNNWEEGNIMITILGSNPSSVTHCFSDTILGLSFLTHKMEIIIERLTGLLWGVWWSTKSANTVSEKWLQHWWELFTDYLEGSTAWHFWRESPTSLATFQSFSTIELFTFSQIIGYWFLITDYLKRTTSIAATALNWFELIRHKDFPLGRN